MLGIVDGLWGEKTDLLYSTLLEDHGIVLYMQGL